MKMFRKEEGFTLVELMVVVLIIGILVAIAIPVFGAAKSNAQKKSCFANQRTIEGAANSYLAEANLYPGTVAVLENAGYLKSIPKCPIAPAPNYVFADTRTAADQGTSTLVGCTYGSPTAHGSYQ